eukprot:tig00021687_g23116.t1
MTAAPSATAGPSICWSCSESESSAPSSPPSSSAPCWLGPRLMKVPVSFPHHSRSGVQDWTNRPARMRDVAGVFTEFQSPRRMRLPLGGRHVYAHYEELAVSLEAHFTAGKPARVVIVARDVPRPGRRHP